MQLVLAQSPQAQQIPGYNKGVCMYTMQQAVEHKLDGQTVPLEQARDGFMIRKWSDKTYNKF